MRHLRNIFAILLIAIAGLTFADKPKPGIYSYTYRGSSDTYHLSIVTRGKNWQVEGALPVAEKIDAKFSGTLYGTSYKLKGVAKYTDRSGKAKETNVNGHWNFTTNHLVVTAGMLWADFTRDGEKTKRAANSFTGTWESSFGTLTLTQAGKHVSGSYDYYSGKVDGDIRADGKLYFKWTQKNPDKQGLGVFTLGSDGNNFSGSWDYTDSSGRPLNNGGGWSGKRKG